jgi:hypothetical protein
LKKEHLGVAPIITSAQSFEPHSESSDMLTALLSSQLSTARAVGASAAARTASERRAERGR